MKQSTLATKLMMSILVLGILIYLAAYAVRGWREELVTTPAYAAVIQVGTDAPGIVIREETVLSGSGAYVDLIPGEGEMEPLLEDAGIDPASLPDYTAADWEVLRDIITARVPLGGEA